MKIKVPFVFGIVSFFLSEAAIASNCRFLEEEKNTKSLITRDFKDECWNICDSCESLDELYNSWGLFIDWIALDACEFVIIRREGLSYYEFDFYFTKWTIFTFTNNHFEKKCEIALDYGY